MHKVGGIIILCILIGCGGQHAAVSSQKSGILLAEAYGQKGRSGGGAITGEEDTALPEEIKSLICVLAWAYTPKYQSETEMQAALCYAFTHGSLMHFYPETDNQALILAGYPEVSDDDYCLSFPEETLKKYLRDSIGYDDISLLKKPDMPFRKYENGEFKLCGYETGDFAFEGPFISKVEKGAEAELLVSGSVDRMVNGQRLGTIIFDLKLVENTDSIWAGYTLSEMIRWEYYVFPNSDTSYLSENDLQNTDAGMLDYGRNEIYARHGYVFKNVKYKSYFNIRTWYEPSMTAVTEEMLNKYEIANRDLIMRYEFINSCMQLIDFCTNTLSKFVGNND